MKRLILFVCIALMPVSGFCMLKKKTFEPEAGDPGREAAVVREIAYHSIFFGGMRFPEEHGSLFSLGIGSSIEGSNLYVFNYSDVGRYGAISSEVAYLFSPFSRLHIGPLAGPNVDWIGNTFEGDPVTYLAGAAGAVVGFNFSGDWGAWGYGKYKFDFDGDTQYRDGYLFGVGLYVGL